MNNEELKKQLNIRYSEALYLGYNKSNLYHFIYAYKRIIIEVIKSYIACFKSLPSVKTNNELAIYATNNQKKALTNAKLAGVFDGEIININQLSFKASLVKLFTWKLKFICYPFAFILSNNKQGLYFTLLPSLMRLYCRLYIEKSIKYNNVKIFLSNDHAGDIFIISIILRYKNHVKTVYIQHGAVKEEFPINYFDEIYVYDKRYEDIYKGLSKNTKCQIIVDERIDKPQINSKELEAVESLICLSHQFPMLNIIKGIKLLSQQGHKSLAIRFHPSDKLAYMKFFILKTIFRKLILSSPMVPYIEDFNRAEKVYCASSSLLIDAFENGFADKLVWVKPFGLEWDYYSLSGKIRTIKSMDALNAK